MSGSTRLSVLPGRLSSLHSQSATITWSDGRKDEDIAVGEASPGDDAGPETDVPRPTRTVLDKDAALLAKAAMVEREPGEAAPLMEDFDWRDGPSGDSSPAQRPSRQARLKVLTGRYRLSHTAGKEGKGYELQRDVVNLVYNLPPETSQVTGFVLATDRRDLDHPGVVAPVAFLQERKWNWRVGDQGPPRRVSTPTAERLSDLTADQGPRQPWTTSCALGISDDGAQGWLVSFYSRLAAARRPRLVELRGRFAKKYAEETLLPIFENPDRISETWLPAIISLGEHVRPGQHGKGAGDTKLGLDCYFHEAIVKRLRDKVENELYVSNTYASAREVQTHAVESWRRRGLLQAPHDLWSNDDSNLASGILGGMCAGAVELPEESTVLEWSSPWGRVAEGTKRTGWPKLHDGAFLPGVTARIDASGTTPTIQSIRARWPDGGDLTWHRPDQAAARYDWCSGDPWSMAKRLLRQSLLISGQLDWHLARCHFFVEYVITGVRQEVKPADAPFRLLWPFLRSADEINELGDRLLLDPTGLINKATPLTAEGAATHMRRVVRDVALDWTTGSNTWKKGEYARWAKPTWQACADYVESWKGEQSGGNHCPPGGRRDMEGHEPPFDWDADQISKIFDALRTPWATPEGSDAPAWLPATGPEDPQALRTTFDKLCAHAIWTATFLHSWVGGKQFADGGNVLLAPLELRWRPADADEGMTRDALMEALPCPTMAAAQVAMAEILGRARWGTLAASGEPGNHPREYRRLLDFMANRLMKENAVLSDVGGSFDLRHIKGRINI